MSDPTFTFISNQRITELMSGAQKRVIYAAPNLSSNIATSLFFTSNFKEEISIRIVVDADAEAFRLGFGEFEGLKSLTDSQIDIRTAPGLRIGVLIVDEKAWVFSPTPEIIFDQPDSNTLNAVEVSEAFAQQILVSIAPELSVNDEDALNTVVLPDSAVPEIGVEKITQQHVVKIERELKQAPPQRFDLARKVNVYKAYYQFVEIELSNCSLGAFTIPISEQLLAIVDDHDVRRRLTAKYKLVEPDSKLKKDLGGIRDAVNDLRKEFTTIINEKVGRVIASERKVEFLDRVESIKSFINTVTDEIETELKNEIAANCLKLAEVLLPVVIESKPRYLRNRLLGDFSDEKKIIDVVVGTMMPSDTVIKNLVEGMKLEVTFKDITYEMLNNEEFVSKIKTMNPQREEIFEEGPAIEEKKKADDN